MMGQLQKLLILEEDLRLKPYRCPAGKLTIGVGRNLEDNGITREEALYLLKNDLQRTTKEVFDRWPWMMRKLGSVQAAVVVDMAFNMGVPRFSNFRKMLAALEAEDFEEAALEMLDSRWATQVGERAVRLSGMMRSGEWPEEVLG